MSTIPYRSALIIGAGPGLGASLARALTRDGSLQVAVAARRPHRLEAISRETGAAAFGCDATSAASVANVFDQASQQFGGPPEVVVYNASRSVRGPFVDIDAAALAQAIDVTALGAFHVAQRAARHMLPLGRGAILFTGASASVKGYPQSAAFAMGKFALRGMVQSMARELTPQGIHIGHVIVDGKIRPPGSGDATSDGQQLDPDAIASTFLHLLAQPRNAWTWEIEVRPWVERF